MKVLMGTLGGAIGGLIGAAIWAAVGYFTGFEVGWIAWGIGAIVGAGVAMGMRGEGGAAGASIAVVLAIGAVLLGKWADVSLSLTSSWGDDEFVISEIADVVVEEEREQGRDPVVNYDAETWQDTYPRLIWIEAQRRWQDLDEAAKDELRECPQFANDQIELVYLADPIVAEYEYAGRSVDWPSGMDLASAWRQWHYPADVWQDALRQWDEMTPAEQEAHRAEVREMIQEGFDEMMSMTKFEWFKQSFSLFDILWLVLAVGTAAKLGAGGGIAVPDAESAIDE